MTTPPTEASAPQDESAEEAFQNPRQATAEPGARRPSLPDATPDPAQQGAVEAGPATAHRERVVAQMGAGVSGPQALLLAAPEFPPLPMRLWVQGPPLAGSSVGSSAAGEPSGPSRVQPLFPPPPREAPGAPAVLEHDTPAEDEPQADPRPEEGRDAAPARPGIGFFLRQPGDLPFWLTTLLVRRLPARCTQQLLLREWLPENNYNFLFLPYSGRQRRASRYAFINFVSAEAARAFYQQWHGAFFPNSPQDALPLSVREAHLQGLRPNLEHHHAIGSDTRRHQPAVFLPDGQRITFAEALAQLQQSEERGESDPWQGALEDLALRWQTAPRRLHL